VINLGKSLGIGLLVILVVPVFATMAHGQGYTVGVKAGDWVKYGQMVVAWTGNGTEPSFVIDENKIDWMRIDVLNVTGTTASLKWTTHYNNATQTFLNFSVDVQSMGAPMLGGGSSLSMLIASNLKAGDPIGAGSERTVNQTVTGTYAGANRNVNIIYNTYSPDLLFFTWKEKFYYDQNTGIMVEEQVNETFYYATLGVVPGQMQVSVKATETNLWSAGALTIIQNNLIYIIAGAAAIIIIVAITIVLRKRKPLAPHPPPPSPSVAPLPRRRPTPRRLVQHSQNKV
jgi:hypothetical protein